MVLKNKDKKHAGRRQDNKHLRSKTQRRQNGNFLPAAPPATGKILNSQSK